MKRNLYTPASNHELNRQLIAQQVEQYLNHGGKIKQIESASKQNESLAQGWRPKVNSFDI